MNPNDLARELSQMADRLEEEMQGVVRQSAVELHSLSQAQSSGGLQPADLARMDHPFARRHGGPQLNPDFVNRQTGAFYAGWQIEDGADGYSASVSNADPKAGLLESGTWVMFARHPEQAAADIEEPLFAERVERAIERIIGD